MLWYLLLLAMLLAAGAVLGHVASRGNWHIMVPDTTLVTALKSPPSVKDVVVELDNAGVYFSKPEMAHFVYPEMISRCRQKEIRYFSGADIRLVCMPIKMPDLDRIRLHYRNHRIRALFPIGHIKLPGG